MGETKRRSNTIDSHFLTKQIMREISYCQPYIKVQPVLFLVHDHANFELQ